MTHAWPLITRRIYRYGMWLWIMLFQGAALLPDYLAPDYWWLWHLLALIPGFAIGHYLTMRILVRAMQEWKNRV